MSRQFDRIGSNPNERVGVLDDLRAMERDAAEDQPNVKHDEARNKLNGQNKNSVVNPQQNKNSSPKNNHENENNNITDFIDDDDDQALQELATHLSLEQTRASMLDILRAMDPADVERIAGEFAHAKLESYGDSLVRAISDSMRDDFKRRVRGLALFKPLRSSLPGEAETVFDLSNSSKDDDISDADGPARPSL